MPRSPRASLGGYCYHLLNRGNNRRTVFHKPGDFEAFLKAARHASERVPMRVLAGCLMPNHFHLVLWPRGDGDLSRWMQWLTHTHVRRYHQHRRSSGHVWQGRFKAFPIQADDHLVTVIGYVERNPVRAGLCRRVEDWAWSSVRWRTAAEPALPLQASPVPLPADWVARLNRPAEISSFEGVRECLNRNRPYGSEAWTRRTARALGVESSLRPRGRPRKRPGSAAVSLFAGKGD